MQVKGYGPPGARIMMVGEAPGKEEDKVGRPFVGPAGDALRKFSANAGINPDEVFYTNICMDRPPNNQLHAWFDKGHPNNTVLRGLMNLQEEIARVQPNVIAALGNFPLWALSTSFELGTYKTQTARWKKIKKQNRSFETYVGIGDWRGSILPSTILSGYKVIPTYHPSYIMREGMKDHGAWICDLQRIARESEFPEIRRPKKDIVIDPKGLRRDEERAWLLKDMDATLTFDIEYMGSKLLCVGMTVDKDRAVVIPIHGQGDVEYCRRILTSGIKLNGQNLMFDASILEWHFGMELMHRIGYDTMLASHATNIELPKNLDYLCSIYTDQPHYSWLVNWKQVEKGRIGLDTICEYNAIDTWVTHEVMEEQKKWDLTDPQIRETFEFELSLINPLWKMSKRGVKIDTENLEKLRLQLTTEIQVMSHALNLWAGEDLNVKSTPKMRELLYKRLDLKPIAWAETGPKCDDKTIAQLQVGLDPDSEAFKIITLVRDIRNRRDLISKFVDVQFDTDGRMRGHYDPAGTDTGRLASRKFYPTGTGGNQQNIPRDKRVRRLFIPDPGYLWVYADLERAESLVVAHITGDPEMLRVHAPGVDAHKELAAILFGVPVEEVDDDQRYLGKQTRHAGNYMEGPRIMMLGINKYANKTGVTVTQGECKTYLTTYKNLHVGLKPWWDGVEQKLWQDRTLQNRLGRIRQFYGHIGSILPSAVAYDPQSTVGDTLNVGLLGLSGKSCQYIDRLELTESRQEHYRALQFYDVDLLMQVHDAVGFQIKIQTPDENMLEEVFPHIEALMSVPLMSPSQHEYFTIPVDFAVGPNWGDTKTWRGN